MGMYTEFHFNAELKRNTPINIIETIKFMVGDIEHVETTPNHPLFNETRWNYMLQCDSYYFDSTTYSILKYDDMTKTYFLNIRCNFKNYNDEIEKFIDWISPYLDKYDGDFLGFYRYEESTDPTLIYYPNRLKSVCVENCNKISENQIKSKG